MLDQLSSLNAQLLEVQDQIDAAYWIFTRSARGNPPPRHLYERRTTLENAIANLRRNHHPMTTKPQLHANLTEEAHRLLKALADAQGISMTALLEVMIRAEAKRKRIK